MIAKRCFLFRDELLLLKTDGGQLHSIVNVELKILNCSLVINFILCEFLSIIKRSTK